jgi:hypothetical protein
MKHDAVNSLGTSFTPFKSTPRVTSTSRYSAKSWPAADTSTAFAPSSPRL